MSRALPIVRTVAAAATRPAAARAAPTTASFKCLSNTALCAPDPHLLSSTSRFTAHIRSLSLSSCHHRHRHVPPPLSHPSPVALPLITTPSNADDTRRHDTHQRSKSLHSLSSSPRSLQSQLRRPRHRHPIAKPPRRGLSSTSSNETRITWRESLKSPIKMFRFLNQIRIDLFNWASHMWVGAKLLATDVRVSSKILYRIAGGKAISRRERNFIVQTGVDLARLVPFSLFLIIPLAEFALPLALRFFPNMLPSQFQDSMQSEEKLKKRLKARLELAKYLRQVVQEKTKQIQLESDDGEKRQRDANDLLTFLDQLNNNQAHQKEDAGDFIRFAKFFNDELTIDGAVKSQLIAMCKYMGISAYGHESFLRFKLRSRISAIKKDDMEIMWEGGVGSLTDQEVRKACKDRGIREEISMTHMRAELNEWLELSQKKEIPGSLLILSRAFVYDIAREDESEVDAAPTDAAKRQQDGIEEEVQSIKETLGSMPEDVIMDVRKAADGGGATNTERLEETLRQEKLIALESDRAQRKEKEDEEKQKAAKLLKEEEEKEKEKEKELEEQQLSEPTVASSSTEKPPASAVPSSTAGVTTTATVSTTSDESIDDKQALQEAEKREDEIREEVMAPVEPALDEEEQEKKRELVRRMLIAMGHLSSDSSVQAERDELRSLKVELAEAEELMRGTEETAEMKRFKTLVSNLEREIERVDTKIGLRLKLLDKDNDGVMSLDECRNAMQVIVGQADDTDDIVQHTLQRLDADADGNISKADLSRLLDEMQFEYGVIEQPQQQGTQGQSQSQNGTSSSKNSTQQ